jgi:maltoporin
MRRVLQLLGLSGLLATGLASNHALAQEQEPASADKPQSTEEPKAAPEAPAAPVVPDVSRAAAAVAVPGKPVVGDTTMHGYLRAGYGTNWHQGGRMTCFGLSTINGGLKSKYRLGNECEQWGEFHFSTVMYSGDDGVVGTFHFMPAVYVPTSYGGYSPTLVTSIPDQGWKTTGASVSFPNLYADIKGISWLFGGTVWGGSRYYKREDVYISDFFYWNPSGLGAGIEDVTLGKIWGDAPDAVKDMTFSYGVFALDGQPTGDPPLPSQNDFGFRNDLQVRGVKPWDGADFQLGFQYLWDRSNHKDANGASVTHGGWGATFRFVQAMLGGDNKFVLQYGKGGGTGFGTLSRFYYPDFSLMWGETESRFRFLDVATIQPTTWLGAQAVFVYQRDDDGLGQNDSVNTWYSAGGRVSLGPVDHLKFLGEAGYDKEVKSNGAPPLWLVKLTGAVALAGAPGFWGRPEIRLFVTWAEWSEAAGRAGIDSARIYTESYGDIRSGTLVGLQTEAMW